MPAPTQSSSSSIPYAQTEPTATSQPTIEFPPITRDQILHCSYDYWYPKYRTSCIKSRIIPLSPEFIQYIREDGIILADDDLVSLQDEEWESAPSSTRPVVEVDDYTDSDSDSDEDEDEPERLPPNQRFPELHQLIKDKIEELGGEVAPKLNWTSPKDATWISPHQNTIKCKCPNDIYLLLKSSNFITHDLEHAFENCTPTASSAAAAAAAGGATTFKPVLVLRSYFNPHTAMEFRCFVKHRNLIAVCQRDPNHFDFLAGLGPAVVARVGQLFNHKLRYTFPDGSFAFDVYVPEEEDEPVGRARLIDINPWAPHTDSLLFAWEELLAWEVPGGPLLGMETTTAASSASSGSDDEGEDGEEDDIEPELRLVEKSDPSAYNFGSAQYSAHKLPKDVVDASLAGEGGMRDFARKWTEMTEYRGDVAEVRRRSGR